MPLARNEMPDAIALIRYSITQELTRAKVPLLKLLEKDEAAVSHMKIDTTVLDKEDEDDDIEDDEMENESDDEDVEEDAMETE